MGQQLEPCPPSIHLGMYLDERIEYWHNVWKHFAKPGNDGGDGRRAREARMIKRELESCRRYLKECMKDAKLDNKKSEVR